MFVFKKVIHFGANLDWSLGQAFLLVENLSPEELKGKLLHHLHGLSAQLAKLLRGFVNDSPASGLFRIGGVDGVS